METTQVLRADAVITCDGQPEVHRPGQVEIDRLGRVVHAGPVRPTTVDAVDVGGLLMPGLVNAHGHGPMTLLRGVGDGLPLGRWLNEEIWPREARLQPGDVEVGMQLASIEMLRAGVTTSCDMYFADHEMIAAVRATGGRLVCTPGVVGVVHRDALAPGGRLDEIRALHAEHHDVGSTVTVGIGPHSPYDLGTEVLSALAEAGRELDTILHLHVAETAAEGTELEAAAGCSTVEHLHRIGVLDGHVLTAHSVWISDDDIGRYAEHGTHVAHCPVSNMKLGSGAAPTPAMLAAGVNVALGTDGVASNDSLSMWADVRMAPLLARVTSTDPTALDAPTALMMATANGGRALGLETGSLTSGTWADVIRLDLDDLAFTPWSTDDDLIRRVVWNAAEHHVTDVWVAGRQVVADGQVTTVDVASITADAAGRGARLSG